MSVATNAGSPPEFDGLVGDQKPSNLLDTTRCRNGAEEQAGPDTLAGGSELEPAAAAAEGVGTASPRALALQQTEATLFQASLAGRAGGARGVVVN